MAGTSASSPIPEGHVRVRFIGNGGTVDCNLPAGSTIEILLNQQNVDPTANTVRVNREAAAPGRVLNDGDTVSATPKKVAGNTH